MIMLWECILKTSTATGAVWIFSLLLRRQSAALRHSLWMCGLAAFLLIPALLPLSQRTPAVHVPIIVDASAPPFPTAIPHPTLQPRIRANWNWNRILLTLWLAGSLVL